MNDIRDPATMNYAAREVVGVFASAQALEAATGALEMEGVSRAAISVLGVDAPHASVADRSVAAIADDPNVPRSAFLSQGSRVEGETACVSVPMLVGGMSGAWAVAAAGGALAIAVGATLAGGVVGAGLGVVLFRAVAGQHAATIEGQIANGGLVLWVSTPDQAAEDRALAVMERCGGTCVHAHEVDREWGVKNVPLHDVQPDPFLEKEPLT